MLAKMPQENSGTSLGKNKLLVVLVLLITGLWLTAGYMMFPLFQSPQPVAPSTISTNNTTLHTPTSNYKTSLKTTTKTNNTTNTPSNSSTKVQKVKTQNGTSSHTSGSNTS
jgi:cytoskeletal protein RodZ